MVFTLIFAGLNAALFYDLIPAVGRKLKNKFETSSSTRLGLTLAFIFGTVHWRLACFGQVWFTAQIIAVTFLLLAIRETLHAGRPLVVGLWLAFSALSRPPVLFALPVFTWLLAETNGPWRLLRILVPPAAAGLLRDGTTSPASAARLSSAAATCCLKTCWLMFWRSTARLSPYS